MQSNFALTQHNIAFQQREMHRRFSTYDNQNPLQLDKLKNVTTTRTSKSTPGT